MVHLISTRCGCGGMQTGGSGSGTNLGTGRQTNAGKHLTCLPPASHSFVACIIRQIPQKVLLDSLRCDLFSTLPVLPHTPVVHSTSGHKLKTFSGSRHSAR